MQDTEKKLIAQIRTRLATKGHSGFTAEEIRQVIAQNHTGELDTVTDETKTAIVDALISLRSSSETVTEDAPPESVDLPSVTEEPPTNDPDMIGMLSTVVEPSPDPVSMVRQEASNMGVDISDVEVNNIAQQVQSQGNYNQDQIGAIKDALIAFVDWQHNQTSIGLNQTIAQVSSYAANRQVEVNNQMVGEVNNFFRVTKQNSQNNFSAIIGALQIPDRSI